MATNRSAAARPRELSHQQVLIQTFANSNSGLKALRKQAEVLLTNENLVRDILGLPEDDQKKFISKVDEAYHTLEFKGAEEIKNKEYIVALGNVCSGVLQLPPSAVLPEMPEEISGPFGSGGLIDTRTGKLGGVRVVIKTISVHEADILKEPKKILWQRVPVWQRLTHPNILRFRGVHVEPTKLSLVYDKAEYCGITQYITAVPQAPRPPLVLDVARGLEYLHGMDMPHGGLRGANVVVKDGRALLIEYGLTGIDPDPRFITLNRNYATNPRWTAPEIIRKRNTTVEPDPKHVDVFAFSMLAVEVFTGKVPFWEEADNKITLGIPNKKRPDKPNTSDQVGLTDRMWRIIERCWDDDPGRRPPIRDVVKEWPDSAHGPVHEPTKRQGEGSGHRGVKHEASPPKVKREALQPEVKQEPSQPEAKHEALQPEVKHKASQHRVKHNTPRPEMKREASQPEVKHEASQPEGKHETSGPKVKRNAPRPEVEHEFSQPGVKHETPQPEVKRKASQHRVKHNAPRPEVKREASQPEVKHEAPQPQVKRKASQPQVKRKASQPQNTAYVGRDVKHEASQPEVKHEASQPEVKREDPQPEVTLEAPQPEAKHEAFQPEVKRKASQHRVKRYAPQPEVKHEASQPEVKHGAFRPEVKREASQSEGKHETSGPTAKRNTPRPEVKDEVSQPEVKHKTSQLRVKSEASRLGTRVETAPQSPNLTSTQPRSEGNAPQQGRGPHNQSSTSESKSSCCGCIIM